MKLRPSTQSLTLTSALGALSHALFDLALGLFTGHLQVDLGVVQGLLGRGQLRLEGRHLVGRAHVGVGLGSPLGDAVLRRRVDVVQVDADLGPILPLTPGLGAAQLLHDLQLLRGKHVRPTVLAQPLRGAEAGLLVPEALGLEDGDVLTLDELDGVAHFLLLLSPYTWLAPPLGWGLWVISL